MSDDPLIVRLWFVRDYKTPQSDGADISTSL